MNTLPTMRTYEPLAMTPALQRRIADSTREIAAAVFGATPSQEAKIQDSATLTASHWHAIRAALLREPHLIAVWFIDSIDLYLLAHRNWPQPSGLGMWYPSLVVFDAASAAASEWLRAPWFASFPGVWAEMSDGKHILFVPKRSAA
jgi:hypothetical protein